MKILLVEDDQATGSTLVESLSAHLYTVNLATDGMTGLELAKTDQYDLLLLDVMVPGLDGVSLCRRLRAEGYTSPIVLLTAKESRSDRILGLDAGADDYVIKPFDLEELLARIRALIRRSHDQSASVLVWETIALDMTNHQVTCGEQAIALTPKEYALLELFLLHPKRIFSRSAILDRLWDMADTPGEETVSTHIKCLRQKLKAAHAANPIETVHGLGYRLRPAAAPGKPSKAEPSSPAPQPQQPLQDEADPELQQQQLKAKTVEIWRKHLPQLLTQVSILEQVAQHLQTDTLSPELHQRGLQEAHKLAGSLGIFGLNSGSHIARQLETLLQPNAPLHPPKKQQIIDLAQALRQVFTQAQSNPTPHSPLLTPPTTKMLIVDDDLMLAERVRIEAIAWGMGVEIATDLTVARQMIEEACPDIALVDLNFPDTTEDGLAILQELAQRQPPVPAIAFTRRESLGDRVAVTRAGGAAFLTKPLKAYEILTTVTQVLHGQTAGNRVLLVDDDKAVLEQLGQRLKDAAIAVTTLAQPQQFWDILNQCQPNLLVLDLEMPDFDGLDLCRVVRQDPTWQHLPILFLSAHATATEMASAFAAGADDFIDKALIYSEIGDRIIRRLRFGSPTKT
ncbi:MAG: response regulator [Oculatellaceae cyanobacterium Prado106]|jgi:DNA-binding response OmpR family regulator|nr:response regulator [Oculatellaceae cyanobacterium Prado106]